MDEYRESNLDLWNNWAQLHIASDTYHVEAFKAGKNSLTPIELEELGDVAGKTLLHLQCHFGKDTMSWARLGATVTGADFSDKAIDIARQLSAELNIPATFVLSDLYNLPNVLHGEFDIVFTSYGAISWLNDIYEWARIASHYLKPGGTFYMAEFHPFAYVFDNSDDGEGLKLAYPYRSDEPLRFETKGSYAAPDADYTGVEYTWNHSMGDIVTALIQAGLRVEFLHEHFVSVDRMYKAMESVGDGYYQLKNPLERAAIPHMFSIRAIKE
ncbi:MAG: methyltransferase domain-containing protein [Chloroflexota bacterium]